VPLFSIIDCEWPYPQDFSKWGCSPTQIKQWMTAYLQEYTRLDNGRKPPIYTYPSWAQAMTFDGSFTQYPLWIASYTTSPVVPHPWTDWMMWQSSGGTQKLPNGVAVDIDYVKDLSLWDVQTVAPTTTPSAPVLVPVPIIEPPVHDAPPPVVTPSLPVGSWQSAVNFLTGLFKR
jgi:hypothetical protein